MDTWRFGRWPATGEIDLWNLAVNVLANVACAGQTEKPNWFSVTKTVDSIGGKTGLHNFIYGDGLG